MDSYIVRVYRRGKGDSNEEVAGLVEEVGTNRRKSFNTLVGLISTIRQVIGRCNTEAADVHELHVKKDAAVNK